MSPQGKARNWQWPATMTKLRDLTGALRVGFTLIERPLPEHATPSTARAFVLIREGEECPPGILSIKWVRIAQREGLIAVIRNDEAGNTYWGLKLKGYSA